MKYHEFIIIIYFKAVVAGLDAAKITKNGENDEKSNDVEDLSSLAPEEKQKQIKKRNKLLRQIEELQAKGHFCSYSLNNVTLEIILQSF